MKIYDAIMLIEIKLHIEKYLLFSIEYIIVRFFE